MLAVVYVYSYGLMEVYEINENSIVMLYQYYLIKHQSWHHIEISPQICTGNQLIGGYMIATLVLNELVNDVN